MYITRKNILKTNKDICKVWLTGKERLYSYPPQQQSIYRVLDADDGVKGLWGASIQLTGIRDGSTTNNYEDGYTVNFFGAGTSTIWLLNSSSRTIAHLFMMIYLIYLLKIVIFQFAMCDSPKNLRPMAPATLTHPPSNYDSNERSSVGLWGSKCCDSGKRKCSNWISGILPFNEDVDACNL
jgi:hypothetical protein